jgi:hypothetical protein
MALGVLAVPALVLGGDARIGTWKLNAAKSKVEAGPVAKSRTVKVEAAGEGIKVQVDAVLADGKTQSYSYAVKYDGKDYPVAGNPDVETIAFKRIDDNTAEATPKKAGQATATMHIAVAADGKTMTVTATGKTDKGPFTNTVVYDKQ